MNNVLIIDIDFFLSFSLQIIGLAKITTSRLCFVTPPALHRALTFKSDVDCPLDFSRIFRRLSVCHGDLEIMLFVSLHVCELQRKIARGRKY